MMVYQEKIAPPPPLALLTAGKQLQLKIEALASDDRWVKDIIDGLAGVLRDVKH
jgi:hypothetical protein